MSRPVLIGDFLHRIRRPIDLDPASLYKLVTVKLKHKGVVLRTEKLGADIKSKMYQVKEGDFILSGIDARNGAFGIVPPELDGAVVTNDFWYFEIDDEVVDKGFFLELTSTHWFDEICRKGSDGTTQRIRLQKGKFFNQTIYLPDLAEQRIFNKRFQTIKASNKTLSSELSHQQTLVKKLRQQILQEAIEGLLTADWRAQNINVEPASELLKRIAAEKAQLIKDKKIKAQKTLPPITDEKKPFELPEQWEWCRLGDIITDTDSGWSPQCKNHSASTGKWGVLKTTAVQHMHFLWEENKELPESLEGRPEIAVKSGDMLITRAGPTNRVGICALVRDTPPKLMLSDKVIRFHPIIVNGKYIELFVGSNVFQEIIKSYKTGMAQSQVNISQSNLKKVGVCLPPLFEQQTIVTKVEKLLALSDQLETQITQNQTHAEQLMQAVLKEAFNHNSTGTSVASEPKDTAYA